MKRSDALKLMVETWESYAANAIPQENFTLNGMKAVLIALEERGVAPPPFLRYTAFGNTVDVEMQSWEDEL